MRAASSPAAKRVKTKCVAAVIAAAMNFMINRHHPHAWTTPVDVRTAGCAMAMSRRPTAAANSTLRKGSAVGPTRWCGASMPAVGLGRVGWPPVGFGARQQARRGPQAYGTGTALRIRSKSAYSLSVSLKAKCERPFGNPQLYTDVRKFHLSFLGRRELALVPGHEVGQGHSLAWRRGTPDQRCVCERLRLRVWVVDRLTQTLRGVREPVLHFIRLFH